MDLTDTETEECLSISCGGMGHQWAAKGTEALGAADLEKEMATHSSVLAWWAAVYGVAQSST